MRPPVDPVDAAPTDAASRTDAPPADGRKPSGALPPPNATLCGQGSISPGSSTTACQAASLADYGPVHHAGKECTGTFTFASGLWEAWCTVDTVYLFARFDGKTGGFTIDPPWGEYAAGNGRGSAPASLSGSSVVLSATLPNKTDVKQGTLYVSRFKTFPSPIQTFVMVGAVALTWQ